jgi:hypothetical protein
LKPADSRAVDAIWSDQCSPEGVRRNCQMVPEFNITMCGISVEETLKVVKLSNNKGCIAAERSGASNYSIG